MSKTIIENISFAGQTAQIDAVNAISLFSATNAGTYLVTGYATVSSAMGTNASVGISIDWNDGNGSYHSEDNVNDFIVRSNTINYSAKTLSVHLPSGQSVKWHSTLNDNTHSGSAPGSSYNVYFLVVGADE